MRPNYTTCQITQGSARCSVNAKFHDFFPFLQDLKMDFEISPKNHTMPECHANLFLTETPCRLLEKATWARIMFNWQTKILWICEHTSQSWQRGGLCLDFQWSHNNSPVADRRMLHFLLDTLTSALTCLLELGLRNWALSLGEDYERITLQCHTETPVLAVLMWVVWS